MSIESFSDYLEAKRHADECARDRVTFERFLKCLHNTPKPRILDAGTGTGAMVRRLQTALHRSPCEIIGLDTDAESIIVARERTPPRGSPEVRFFEHSLFSAEALSALSPLSAITAHSFVDEFPPGRLLSTCAQLLEEKGLLYTSLTYNGRTEFWPESVDREYERAMLSLYDHSMDKRLFDGEATAGSKGASRLLGAAENHGFEIVSFGGSDWCIQPRDGVYPDDDDRLLHGMVDFVANEMNHHVGMDHDRTEAWRAERKRHIRDARLRLLVHHLDSLLRLRLN